MAVNTPAASMPLMIAGRSNIWRLGRRRLDGAAEGIARQKTDQEGSAAVGQPTDDDLVRRPGDQHVLGAAGLQRGRSGFVAPGGED